MREKRSIVYSRQKERKKKKTSGEGEDLKRGGVCAVKSELKC